MEFKEVEINNRLQIDTETRDNGLETFRGIVIDINNYELTLVTDFGKLITINKNDVLSITKISFDRTISSSLINIKNYYHEKKELEDRLKELIKQEDKLIEDLFDANMLARFNIAGAKNRLDKSIPKKLLNFKRGIYDYNIYFSYNPNNEIEIIFKASNTFEHYNPEKVEMDKIVRVHAPNEKDVIEKSFNYLGTIKEIDKSAVHEEKNIYTVFTIYKMFVEVTANNFVQVRKKIIKGLEKLRR